MPAHKIERITTHAAAKHCAAAAAIIIGAAVLAPGTLAAQRYNYSVERQAQAATAGVTTIRIENGSGRLVINGRNGASAVNATAVIRGSSQATVNAVKLVAERSGDVITVRADSPDRNWGSGDGWSADLTVEVPSSVHLDVSDGSGGAQLDNVGSVNVRSGSGGIRINTTAGAVDLRSGSGEAQLKDIHGNVSLTTGSGSITVQGVTGSVDLRSAGSGSLHVGQISGAVHVGSVGSGSITADGVGGDLIVEHAGSGSVNYSNVKGRVDIPSRRSRDR